MARPLLSCCVLLLAACGGADSSTPSASVEEFDGAQDVLSDAGAGDGLSDLSPQDVGPDLPDLDDGVPPGPDIPSLEDTSVEVTEDAAADTAVPGDLPYLDSTLSDASDAPDGGGTLDGGDDVASDATPPEDVPELEDVSETTPEDTSGSEDVSMSDLPGDTGYEDVQEEVQEEVQEDVEPVDPCLGANCDDGDPCTQNSCVDGECVFSIEASFEGTSCGEAHLCMEGQCVPDCASPVVNNQDLTASPGTLVSDNCGWTAGSGWVCSGAGDAGALSAPELEGLFMFRLDLTVALSSSGELAVTWPLSSGDQWRTVRLSTSELSITSGPGALSESVSLVGPLTVALEEGVHKLTIIRLVDQSLHLLVNDISVVKTGVLPSAPELLDLTIAPAFLTVDLLGLGLSSLVADCDDQNPCTGDACDWLTGSCLAEDLVGTPCPDDGLPCTTEACGGGDCEHKVVEESCLIDGVCYDAGTSDPTNPCAVCTPASNQQAFSPVDPQAQVPCDDGDPCTESDLCQGLGCLGVPKDCDDASSCTLDLCVEGLCEHIAGPDGLWCGEASLCSEGACASACLGPPDLASDFSDGSGLWAELAGSWTVDSGVYAQSGGGQGGVTHPALSGLQAFSLSALLTITEDDPTLGTQGVARVDLYEGELTPGGLPRYRVQLQTNHPVFGGSVTLSFSGPGFLVQVDQAALDLPVGQPVEVSLEFTPNSRLEVHVDGELVVDLTDFGGLPDAMTVALGFDQHGTIDDVTLIASGQFCDDGLSCTDDLCMEDGSCEAALIPETCLVDGLCWEAGASDPDNVCALCDPGVSGESWSPSGSPETPVTCVPADPCDEDGLCASDSLECVGSPVVCDDDDPCTDDACLDGVCTFTPVDCDDDDDCTTDGCDAGVCGSTPIDCDDDDACTADSCLEGQCVSEPIEGCGDQSDSGGADGSGEEDGSGGGDDPGPDPP